MDEQDKEIYRKFGKNIRCFRKERNLSIKKLSELTGLNVQYLYRVENGKAYRLNTGHLLIFAKAFELKLCEIVQNL